MADTTFVDGTTTIVAAWLNDINDYVYTTSLGNSTITGVETLTNKTLTSPTINSPVLATVPRVGMTSATSSTTTGAITIDWSVASRYLQLELTGGATFTFTAPGVSNIDLQLIIDSDGTSTSRTTAWPASVVWYTGTTGSTTINKKMMYTFYWDGTTYHGKAAAQV